MINKTSNLTLIFSFFTICLFGQHTKTQHDNFYLKERKIIWQKIYDTNKSLEEIENYFIKQPLTKNLKLVGSSLIGTSSLTKASSNKGYSWSYTDFTMFITIDYKEGRYRVTLKDFKYKPIETSIGSGMFEISEQVSTTLSQSYLRNKKDEIRKNKPARNYLSILNKDFDQAFEIKEAKTEKDDW